MSTINALSQNYLQSLLGTQQISSSKNNQGANGLSSTAFSAGPSDSGRVSPFAQLLSSLQQLQETDPTKYKQVTQQIATNLQTAAQDAQSSGNTTAATQLNQLATDFTDASQNGQLPNVQDLAQAVGGHRAHGHHGHHHVEAQASDSQDTGQQSSASPSSTSQSSALNPASIIANTLAGAGVDANYLFDPSAGSTIS